ncbi:MAG: SDR family NAD(P)-dependent oxidoreductase [Verrucomicrobia bacterium]|nr:SDR family NAD(P)-dependent oxidoreductase [Verrucomicrobiota bacterium]
MARALASRGVKLALVAYPGEELESLRQQIAAGGTQAVVCVADLREPEEIRRVARWVRATLGPIDILVNNAGIEYTSAYHDLSEAQIREIIRVNLEAPMLLTRLLLPEMVERRYGHIVNISSLAGKSGPAFQEPYAATKAGVVAFTASLRATYCGSGVSASVVTPGFVEAGIYARLKSATGCQAPWQLGTSPPAAVASAVLRCIEFDLPEVIINPLPVRPILALAALFPKLGEWVIRQTGVHEFFRRVVAANADHSTDPRNDTSETR